MGLGCRASGSFLSCCIAHDISSTDGMTGVPTAVRAPRCQRSPCFVLCVAHDTEKYCGARFPQSITDTTRVPAWAFLNITTVRSPPPSLCAIDPYGPGFPQASAPWNNVTACDFGDLPESVGSFRPSFAPKFSTGSALSAGVIAGVIAGSSVTGLAAIVAGVWYLVHRRRRRRTPIVNNEPNPLPIGGTAQLSTRYPSVAWRPQPGMRFYVRVILFASNGGMDGCANDIRRIAALW